MLLSLSSILTKKLVSTVAVTIIMAIVFYVCRIIIRHHFESIKKRKRYQLRILYIIMVVFLIFIARIWIEGFSNIFTILGLIGAALVVTNKESIMNIVAWFVISWRSLFSEGDFIEINGKSGYVLNIGAFYFTLSNQKTKKTSHAKLIKVPNGFVLNNVLINYSQTDALFENTLEIFFALTSDMNKAQECVVNTLSDIAKHHIALFNDSLDSHEEKFDETNFKVNTSIKLNFEKIKSFKLTASFGSIYRIHQDIESDFWVKLIEAVNETPGIELTYG